MRYSRWQDWVMLVLGVWFMFSPLILGYRGAANAAAVNAYLFGAIVTVLAIVALLRPQMWEEWVNLVLGLWLIIAPFVLGFQDEVRATTNHIIVGLLIAIDAVSVLIDFPTTRALPRR